MTVTVIYSMENVPDNLAFWVKKMGLSLDQVHTIEHTKEFDISTPEEIDATTLRRDFESILGLPPGSSNYVGNQIGQMLKVACQIIRDGIIIGRVIIDFFFSG